MKKVLLLTCLLGSTIASFAQYSLSGASPYVQDFNTLATGLPSGWKVYSGSSASSIGTLGNYSSAPSDAVYNYNHDTTCGNTTGGFKNLPSANVATMEGASCTAQQSSTDRALGVRQVSALNTANPNLDSGAAFVFQVTNTVGISNLSCTFKLQSLDSSSPRKTTWRLQYRIGTTGTWTQVTPTGTMTTGGLSFDNHAISASFGSALNNMFTPVYIRIVTLDFSNSTLGTGNRASTGIDDFNLIWTGTAAIENVNSQNAVPFSVIGDATTANINFGFTSADASTYTVVLSDMTGRVVTTKNVQATPGEQSFNVNGLGIAPGMYVAKITNGAVSGVTKVSVQ